MRSSQWPYFFCARDVTVVSDIIAVSRRLQLQKTENKEDAFYVSLLQRLLLRASKRRSYQLPLKFETLNRFRIKT